MKRSYGRAFYGSGIDAGSAVAAQAGLGGSSGVVKQDDLIYANLTCINSGLNTDGQSLGPPVQFQEARAVNLLDNSSDYMLTIIRWTSTGLQLPLFIPSIDTYPGIDPNKTTYQIGITAYTAPGTTLYGKVTGAINYGGGVPGVVNSTLVISNTPTPALTMQLSYADAAPAVGDSCWLSNVPDQWVTTGLTNNKTVNGFAEPPVEGGGGGIAERQLTVVSYNSGSKTLVLTTPDGLPFSTAFCNAEYNDANGNIYIPSTAGGVKLSGGDSVVSANTYQLYVYLPTQNYLLTLGTGTITNNSGNSAFWPTVSAWASDLQTSINAVLAAQTSSYASRLLSASGATVTATGSVGANTTPVLTVTLPWKTQTTGALGYTNVNLNINGPTFFDASMTTSIVGALGYACTLSGGTASTGNANLNGVTMYVNALYAGTSANRITLRTNAINGYTPPSVNSSTFTVACTTNGIIRITNTANAGAAWNTLWPTATAVNGTSVVLSAFGGTAGTKLNGITFSSLTYSGNLLTFPVTGLLTTDTFSGGVMTAVWNAALYGMTATTWPSAVDDPNQTLPGSLPGSPTSTGTAAPSQQYSVMLGFNNPQGQFPSPEPLPGTQPSSAFLWNLGSLNSLMQYGYQAGQGNSMGFAGLAFWNPISGGDNLWNQGSPQLPRNAQAYSPPVSALSYSISQQIGPGDGRGAGIPFVQLPETAGNWAPVYDTYLTATVTGTITNSGAAVTFPATGVNTSWLLGYPVTVSGASGTLNGTAIITAVTSGTSVTLTYNSTPTVSGSAGTLTLLLPITLTGGTHSYDPYVFVRTLQWTPQYPNDVPPTPPSSNGGNMDIRQGSRYYWATDVQHVLDMVNAGLADAWLNVYKHAIPVGGSYSLTNKQVFGYSYSSNTTLNNPQPPQFVYSNNTIQLLLPWLDYTFNGWKGITGPDGDGWGSPGYVIQMNPALYALFRGFPARFQPSPATSTNSWASSEYPTADWGTTDNESSGAVQGVFELVGPSVTAIMAAVADQATGTGAAGVPSALASYAYPVTQESTCTDNWAAVSALSFHTSLPIVPEDESAPAQSGAEFQPSTSQDIVTSMTDIQLELAGGVTDWKGKINYAPSAQYRWTLMRGGPVQNIPFTVYWKHRNTGRRYLVTMEPNGSVEVKMLLQRRKH